MISIAKSIDYQNLILIKTCRMRTINFFNNMYQKHVKLRWRIDYQSHSFITTNFFQKTKKCFQALNANKFHQNIQYNCLKIVQNS